MQIEGWKYYNHAVIPTTAPHEVPSTTPIKDGNIWKIEGGTPLLARWTTEFDCGYETNWWYIIKNGPFDFEVLNPRVKKHVRQSLKKVLVKRIYMADYSDELCTVHNNACKGYSCYTGGLVSATDFLSQDESVDCWAAFSIETKIMVGYMSCRRRRGCVETITAKYDPAYLNLRASDALHFTVLDHYLNNEKYEYVSSGSRTINHVTNAQDYKISTFGFRRAYCHLHIVYNPRLKWMIQLLFPFRKVLLKLDRIRLIHQINSVLRMEELVRKK